MNYSQVTSKRIDSLCKEKHITYNRLATLAGINQSTIDNIIRGETKTPNMRTLHRISQGFDMTLSEFLDFPEMNEDILDEDE